MLLDSLSVKSLLLTDFESYGNIPKITVPATNLANCIFGVARKGTAGSIFLRKMMHGTHHNIWLYLQYVQAVLNISLLRMHPSPKAAELEHNILHIIQSIYKQIDSWFIFRA